MSTGLSILKLLSGRVAVQVLSFLTVPILTRLFLPEHFGVIQIFDSISKVFIVVTCLKYEMSIPLARNDKEAAASFALSVLIACMVTVLTLAGVLVSRGSIAAWFKISELQRFLWLLPPVVLASSIKNIQAYWAAREGQFGGMAWSDLGNSLTERLTSISWGVFIGASATGLLVGRLIGIGTGIGVLLLFLKRKLFFELKNARLSFETLWIVVKRHKKFPIFYTWTVLLNSISVQLPPLVLGTYFSTTIVGYYALGYRTITLPMSMLRDSIARVFFPVAAKEYHEFGSLTDVVSKFFTRLVQIGIFPMLILSFIGSVLFAHVFGHQWIEAGVYAQMLSFWYALAFVSAPLNVFIILNRHELSLLMNIAVLAARAASLLIGVTFGSPRITIGIFAATSVCIPLISIIWQLRLAHISVLWALKTIGQYIAISCLLIFPVRILTWFTDDFITVVGALCLITISYIGILFKLDPSFRQFIHK